jgi:hypothetical protein
VSESSEEVTDTLVRRAGEAARAEQDDRCVECGRHIDKQGRWYSDGLGALVPYCKSCALREFPVI